jgi:uncharacterized protein YukE
MARHEVNSEAISDLIAQLNSVTEFSNQLISQIETVKASVSAEWTGEANLQYQALHAEWLDGARKMANGAHQITTRATISAANYSEVADHVKGLWS